MAFEEIVSQGLITPRTSPGSTGQSDVKVSFTRGSIKYDSPFMDMTSTYLPSSIKGILRFVASYVVGDGFVSQCITKMSEYPITSLIYDDEISDNKSSIKDSRLKDNWRTILEKKIKILMTLKQAGMDYYAYGNSLVSVNFPFIRMLTCEKCGATHNAKTLDGVKFKNFKYVGKCSRCSHDGAMEYKDINVKDYSGISIVHWDIMCIHIKYNSITGEHFYYYTVPKDIAAAISTGDMDIVNSTRAEVIEAVKSKKKIKLISDNVYHLKRPAPQYLVPSERGWGIPVVLAVMKDVFHTKILKKGNEMIAFDHIMPLRILFPQGTGDVSPHMTINLSAWRTKIEDEIRKWKADPNYISIVPIPLGMQNFSGDAKVLMVTQEIRATEDAVITGIGVIPEIIRGGASWSGSNVSLRIVENSFINHRNDIQNLIDFIIDKVSTYLGIKRIEVKMSDFKMADDLEKKRMMMGGASGPSSDSIFSMSRFQKEMGIDPEKDYEERLKELKRRIELRVREAEGDAEARGAAAIINAIYQADAEMENRNRIDMHQREEQRKRDEHARADQEQNAEGVDQDVGILSDSTGKDKNQISIPNLILAITQRFARLAQIDKEEFKIRMLAMKNATPSLYSEVYNNMREMNIIEADLIPDLEQVQKYTPGEIPSTMQGESFGDGGQSPAESGASVSLIKSNPRPLPEAPPPRSIKSPI